MNGLSDLDGIGSFLKKAFKGVAKVAKFVPGIGQAVDIGMSVGGAVVKGVKGKKAKKVAQQAEIEAQRQAEIQRQEVERQRQHKMELAKIEAAKPNYMPYIALGGGGLVLFFLFMMMRR
jgi:hypothetical protein